jgi:hypothetical protein
MVVPSTPPLLRVLQRPVESALGAPITVMDEPALGRVFIPTAAPDGVLQRAQHQLGIGPVAGLPADDLPGEGVADAGQPQRPLPGGDPRDVGHPQPVGRVGLEVAVDQVGRWRRLRVLPGRAAPTLAQERPPQTVSGHQPLHPLAADLDAVAAQLRVDSGRPVGPARTGVDRADLVKQPGVPASALARITLLGHPAVEGRGGDFQHPEDGLDPEQVTMDGRRSS